MMNITEQLFALRDETYSVFQCDLVPGVPKGNIIGVRVPALRQLAKTLRGTPEAAAFLEALPHRYYDENMLHGLLVAELRDFDGCLAATEAFLPYVDNWAVCDTFSPKVFGKHKPELLAHIKRWMASDAPFTVRFGTEMLMRHFLDADFRPEYLALPAALRSEEYYVNMMTAWYFATALAKQWDSTIPYLEQQRLDVWVHNKTIQKARESFRVTPAQKDYLKSLKRG